MSSQSEAAIEQASINNDFSNDVLAGLSQSQKTLPCKYFYDERGSQLFEAICDTPEYYVTRAECSIYKQFAKQMARLIGSQALIIEPGAGSVQKISYLLSELDEPIGFIPMDISPEILAVSSAALRQQFPMIDISPRVVDFNDANSLKGILHSLPQKPLVHKRVVFFPGSTIGNFKPSDAIAFLRQFSHHLQAGDGLLIGVDRVKDHRILEAAYNDQAGITAEFNFNLLKRINNELNGDFDLECFTHKAIFNPHDSRIEMHLVSRCDQQVNIADNTIDFVKDESIHTENSYKYTPAHFITLAAEAGFVFEQQWSDNNDLFSVYYFSVT